MAPHRGFQSRNANGPIELSGMGNYDAVPLSVRRASKKVLGLTLILSDNKTLKMDL